MTDPVTPAARPPLRLGMLLGVLGVVYGDIGTSPLYAFKASMDHFKQDGVVRWEVLGILSMIFWSLVLIVTVKYVRWCAAPLRDHPGGHQRRLPVLRRRRDHASDFGAVGG